MELASISKMDNPALKLTAGQIRNKIIEHCANNGGYLSTNLSCVEISVALNKVFDKEDRLIFSGSEMDYSNRIINNETIDDKYHINALSTGLGMAIARDLDHLDYNVISIINSNGALSGSNIEALNQIGMEKRKQIIIFNDDSSIDNGIGIMDKFVSNLRNTKAYVYIKNNVKEILKPKKGGEKIIEGIHNFKSNIKKNVIDEGVFGEFNIDYIGPINGHNIPELVRAFEIAKTKEYPCVVHCITTKGKGFIFAESSTNQAWDYCPAFDQLTGKYRIEEKENFKHYSTLLANELLQIMEKDNSIVLLSPMNKNINKLNEIFAKYPERTFDINLGSENAINCAIGLSKEKKIPFVSLNSNDIEKAYTSLIKNIDNSNNHVVIAIATRDYNDLTILNKLNNTIVHMVSNYENLKDSLTNAFKENKPYIICYPMDFTEINTNNENNEFEIGKWDIVANNDMNNIVILSNSFELNRLNATLQSNYLKYKVINTSFINPIDDILLENIFKESKKIYVYDDVIKEKVLYYFSKEKYSSELIIVENNQIKNLFDKISKEN